MVRARDFDFRMTIKTGFTPTYSKKNIGVIKYK